MRNTMPGVIWNLKWCVFWAPKRQLLWSPQAWLVFWKDGFIKFIPSKIGNNPWDRTQKLFVADWLEIVTFYFFQVKHFFRNELGSSDSIIPRIFFSLLKPCHIEPNIKVGPLAVIPENTPTSIIFSSPYVKHVWPFYFLVSLQLAHVSIMSFGFYILLFLGEGVKYCTNSPSF